MATHSSILAWEVPWTEQTGHLQSMTERLNNNFFFTLKDNVMVFKGAFVA